MLAEQDLAVLHRVCNTQDLTDETLALARKFQKAWHYIQSGACPSEFMLMAAIFSDAIEEDHALVPTQWATTAEGTWLIVKEKGGGQFKATFVKEHGGPRQGQLEVKAFGTETMPVLSENCFLMDEFKPTPIPVVPENQEPTNRVDELEAEREEKLDVTEHDPTIDDCTIGDAVSFMDGNDVTNGEFVESDGESVTVNVDGRTVTVERSSVVVT